MKQLVRCGRPLYVLFSALTYLLGAAVADYLGVPLRVRVLVFGLLVILLLQLAMDWLDVAFRRATEPLIDGESAPSRARTQRGIVYAAITALAATAALVFALLVLDGASTASALWIGISLVIVLVYAVPPMRAFDRGFGELLLAVQIGYVVPSISFLLEAQENHLLLNVCAVALTFLMIALLIVMELPSYAEDLGRGRVTLLTRTGWQRGLALHHAVLLAAYSILGIAMLSALSFSVIGPALLTLPFAALQFLLLRGVASGAKPIWSLLRANALAIFVLTTYFLTLSFWLR